MNNFKTYLFIFLFCFGFSFSKAQLSTGLTNTEISYSNPQKYILGEVTISGTKFLDHNTLIEISGLEIGKTITIPGDKISNAITKLWD